MAITNTNDVTRENENPDPNDAQSPQARAEIASQNVIHAEGDSSDEELQDGGFVGSMPGSGTGGLSDVTGGRETRGDMSGGLGAKTGSVLGGATVPGMDVNSTDSGRSDITGGGTASGLGATNGAGTA